MFTICKNQFHSNVLLPVYVIVILKIQNLQKNISLNGTSNEHDEYNYLTHMKCPYD